MQYVLDRRLFVGVFTRRSIRFFAGTTRVTIAATFTSLFVIHVSEIRHTRIKMLFKMVL